MMKKARPAKCLKTNHFAVVSPCGLIEHGTVAGTCRESRCRFFQERGEMWDPIAWRAKYYRKGYRCRAITIILQHNAPG